MNNGTKLHLLTLIIDLLRSKFFSFYKFMVPVTPLPYYEILETFHYETKSIIGVQCDLGTINSLPGVSFSVKS